MKLINYIHINLFLLLIILGTTFYAEAQNVGIGTTNPLRPLSFPAILGKKISLYPGALGDAGFGVFGNELRIHSDYLYADITFGYDDYTLGFTERMRIGNAYDIGMYLNGRIILKNGTSPLDLNYGAGIWLYKADNSDLLGFMGTQNNQNIGFYGGPVGWGLTYDAVNSRVGMGTSVPLARLHVVDSSVVFSSYNYPWAAGAPPIQGFGTRFMWYANRSSLRAGFVDGTQWNQDSIGSASFAAGYNVKAKGDYSIATGIQTSATGIASTAMGYNTMASGYYATALGVSSQAIGSACVALGSNTMASNWESTALGSYTVASGFISFAAGSSTLASGDHSTSFGWNTKAIGFNTTAMGYQTKAVGTFSTSMGTGSRSGGDYSTAIGFGLNAKCYSSFVTGMYNDSVSTIDETTPSPTSPLFIIGNGADNVTRSNAFVVLQNGDTWLAGILSGPSDIRLKKDIQPLKNSLTKLTQLNGYNFYWKSERSSAAMQTGVIAQEVQKLFPELVKEDKEGMLSVNYSGLIPVLIESTKELKQQVDQLKKQNEEIMTLLHQLQENK